MWEREVAIRPIATGSGIDWFVGWIIRPSASCCEISANIGRTMTSIVTEVTRVTIESYSYDNLSTTIGILVVVLLVVLLIQKELIRGFNGSRSRIWMQVLDIAIVPLLLTFSLMVIMHFVDLLK